MNIPMLVLKSMASFKKAETATPTSKKRENDTADSNGTDVQDLENKLMDMNVNIAAAVQEGLSVYNGEWQRDMRHGYGYQLAKEYRYDGEWVENKVLNLFSRFKSTVYRNMGLELRQLE